MLLRKLVIVTLLPLTILASCRNTPKSDEAKTGDVREVALRDGSATYTINTTESKMEWIGTKLSTYHHGEVAITSGEIFLSGREVTGGKFVVNMSTIVARDKGGEDVNEKLTSHLKSPDFFDVTNYPEATFEITGVRHITAAVTKFDEGAAEISEYKVTDPNYIISGNLKIKEITKNIEFPARITATDTKAEAIAKFKIDRKLWNITYPGMPDDMIQDMIWFGISIQANAEDQTALR